MQFLKCKGSTKRDYYNVFTIEAISMCVVPTIITIIMMLLQNDTVLCTDVACYLHRHSWVCFVGWIPINIWVYSMIASLAVAITTIPVHYTVISILINVLSCIILTFKYIFSHICPQKSDVTNLTNKFKHYNEKEF